MNSAALNSLCFTDVQLLEKTKNKNRAINIAISENFILKKKQCVEWEKYLKS